MKTVVKCLEDIVNDLIKKSGYPLKTVKDPNEAYAYGLAIGAISRLVADWTEPRSKK